MWDAGCKTIASAGYRRGAMMATLLVDHPDIIEFITATTTPGVLTQFSLSVMITDAFMTALAAGEARSEEHPSALQSLMRLSYAAFCMKTPMYIHSTTSD